MDAVWAYVVWAAQQITPQGVLVGLIAGAWLTWLARNDWEQVDEELPFETEDASRPVTCGYWREDGCDGHNCCLNSKCTHARKSQPWLFDGTVFEMIDEVDDHA